MALTEPVTPTQQTTLTSTQQQLLRLLADGTFHSGTALGTALGVSRTAVWKALDGIAALGIDLERAPRLGYRVAGGIDLHDGERIRAALGTQARALLAELQVLTVTESTNEAAKGFAPVSGQGACCLAEYQTGGRGRLGRTWASPFARNLYCSLAWDFDDGIAALEGLSLAVGVAVRRALAGLGAGDIGLKWPNDLLRDGRKLGGILVEVAGDPEGRCRAVIGIGINVAMPAAAARTIHQPWSDLADLPISRNALAAAVLTELLPLLRDFPTHGFRAHRAEWEANDHYRDRPVSIRAGNHLHEGIARGVNDHGALALECTDGLLWFSGGEVSLRGAQ